MRTNFISEPATFCLNCKSPVFASKGALFNARFGISSALWVTLSMLVRIFSKPGYATSEVRPTMLVAGLMLLIRGFGFSLLWLGNRLGKGDCLLCIAAKRVK